MLLLSLLKYSELALSTMVPNFMFWYSMVYFPRLFSFTYSVVFFAYGCGGWSYSWKRI